VFGLCNGLDGVFAYAFSKFSGCIVCVLTIEHVGGGLYGIVSLLVPVEIFYFSFFSGKRSRISSFSLLSLFTIVFFRECPSVFLPRGFLLGGRCVGKGCRFLIAG